MSEDVHRYDDEPDSDIDPEEVVTEDALPVEGSEDQAPEVTPLDLDEIEQFDEAVEKHDEVGEGAEDGDSTQAETEPEAATDPVTGDDVEEAL